MRPEIPSVFATFAADLVMRVAPAIAPAYHQGTIGMIATMLAIAGEEWDRAASWRVEENRRLRELFRESLPVTHGELREKLEALIETRDDDLRISALTSNNSALRAALIELHVCVESKESAEARRVEVAIWNELRESTERRRLSIAQF
ncbi:MAG: hypothetical protein Q7S58_10510 [Candidatus Binatus sp.]|uniref:hypothetical protein n=1 Tax=Candidatus Binatus sp. TaxID=2811406 RepID=UPI002716A502|nr:hypothetical protein [Candidatus Binatus sp.]MDO8432825.1 hypothetical protein [Candidatus Binatus sp.]